MGRIFLLQQKTKLHLSFQDVLSNNWNLPMDSNDFSVYKQSTNVIEFVIRNSDRKPINLVGKTLDIVIVDNRDKRLIIKKPLTIVDPIKGLTKLILLPTETVDWDIEYLGYTVRINNEDGTTNMLYLNQTSAIHGTITVIPGSYPGPKETIETSDFFIYSTYSPYNKYYCTDNLPGNIQTDNRSGIHSFAAYLDNFSGSIYINGSLDIQPPVVPDQWFNLYENEYTEYTGILPLEIIANLNWVKFVFKSIDDNNLGVKKVMFRN